MRTTTDAPVFEDYRALKMARAALRRAYQKRAAKEAPALTRTPPPLEFSRPEDATVEIAPFAVSSEAPPVPCYYVDAHGQKMPYITDDEGYLAALRAQLGADTEVGPVQEWAALVRMPGDVAPSCQVFRGTLSALRRLLPCEEDLITWERAGVDVSDLPRPIQVERYGYRLPAAE